MLAASVCMLPLVLIGFLEDSVLVTRITCMYTLMSVALYLSGHLKRRFKIKAPTPIGGTIAIIGWALWIPVLTITDAGKVWEAQLAIVTALGFWSIIGSTIIFVTFLATFVTDTDMALE